MMKVKLIKLSGEVVEVETNSINSMVEGQFATYTDMILHCYEDGTLDYITVKGSIQNIFDRYLEASK